MMLLCKDKESIITWQNELLLMLKIKMLQLVIQVIR